jgi:ligand-binding sensor domain-containing protein
VHGNTAGLSGHPLDLLDMGAPTFTTFSARDGVPDSVIVNIQTDREGFVWLASSQGVARYDGHCCNAVDPPAIKGVLANFTLDHDGNLWAGLRDRGLARFDGRQWQFEKIADQPPDHLRRVNEAVDAHGKYALYATSFGSGVYRRDGTRWVPVEHNDELPAMTLSVARTQSIGGHERMWVGTLSEGF